MDENVEWRKITCYNVKDNYQINEYGVIYNEKTKRFLRGRIDQHGYYQVKLSTKAGKIKSFLTHRLVAMTFLEYDENNVYNGRYGVGMTVDHIDGNKLNNHYSNLRWISFFDNVNGARDLGYNNPDAHYARITEDTAKEVIECIQNLYNTKEIMEITGESKNVIMRISQGQRWKHLTKNLDLKMPYSHKHRDIILTTVYYILNNNYDTSREIYNKIITECNNMKYFDELSVNYISHVKYGLHSRYQKYIDYIQHTNWKPSTTIQ